jgi:hypothetical protein
MAEAAYATGPALLGAPRLITLFYFSRIFLFHVSVRDPNSAPVRGPKEPKSSRKREAPKFKKRGPIKLGPKLFPVSVFQRGAPKSPRSSVRKRQAPKFKNRGPNSRVETVFLFPVSAQDPNSAGPQRVQGP